MNNQDIRFIEQFESRAMTSFKHVDHLRLAFLYIQRDGVEQAVTQTCTGIRQFAESVGAHDKYHQTITEALVRIMGVKFYQQPVTDWQEFLDTHPQLVNDASSVLYHHYSPDRLKSAQARQQFLPPDRVAFDVEIVLDKG